MEKLPRGLRNNNPGNMRINKDRFTGEIQPSQDGSFKQFESIVYGYRAMFVDLSTKLKRGKNTIRKIIEVWAPTNENDTELYIRKVAEWSGVPENKILTDSSGKDYINIVAAMSRMENTISANMEEVKEGFKLQNRIR